MLLGGSGGSSGARDGGVASTRGGGSGSRDVAILRRDRLGECGRKPFVFLASFANSAPGYQVLKLFVSAEAQHFFAATGRIPGPEIFVHDIKELLELERCSARKHRNQFFGHEIGNSTGECVFLENSHRAGMI